MRGFEWGFYSENGRTTAEGTSLGRSVGAADGLALGEDEGAAGVGLNVGYGVVGLNVGGGTGFGVGCCVGLYHIRIYYIFSGMIKNDVIIELKTRMMDENKFVHNVSGTAFPGWGILQIERLCHRILLTTGSAEASLASSSSVVDNKAWVCNTWSV